MTINPVVAWPGDVFGLVVAGVSSAHTAENCETTICSGGTFTVTLPAALTDADNLITNTGTGTVTVAAPEGVDLYSLTGGTGNITLSQGESARIRSDGASWYRVS